MELHTYTLYACSYSSYLFLSTLKLKCISGYYVHYKQVRIWCVPCTEKLRLGHTKLISCFWSYYFLSSLPLWSSQYSCLHNLHQHQPSLSRWVYMWWWQLSATMPPGWILIWRTADMSDMPWRVQLCQFICTSNPHPLNHLLLSHELSNRDHM